MYPPLLWTMITWLALAASADPEATSQNQTAVASVGELHSHLLVARRPQVPQRCIADASCMHVEAGREEALREEGV
jgi:hypothetical protein